MREREREMRRIVAVSPFLLFGSGGWVGGGGWFMNCLLLNHKLL